MKTILLLVLLLAGCGEAYVIRTCDAEGRLWVYQGRDVWVQDTREVCRTDKPK